MSISSSKSKVKSADNPVAGLLRGLICPMSQSSGSQTTSSASSSSSDSLIPLQHDQMDNALKLLGITFFDAFNAFEKVEIAFGHGVQKVCRLVTRSVMTHFLQKESAEFFRVLAKTIYEATKYRSFNALRKWAAKLKLPLEDLVYEHVIFDPDYGYNKQLVDITKSRHFVNCDLSPNAHDVGGDIANDTEGIYDFDDLDDDLFDENMMDGLEDEFGTVAITSSSSAAAATAAASENLFNAFFLELPQSQEIVNEVEEKNRWKKLTDNMTRHNNSRSHLVLSTCKKFRAKFEYIVLDDVTWAEVETLPNHNRLLINSKQFHALHGTVKKRNKSLPAIVSGASTPATLSSNTPVPVSVPGQCKYLYGTVTCA